MYNSQLICFEHLYKAHIQHINIYPIIGFLKFVTETQASTIVKTLQILPTFTNHPLFISLIGCQSRKPQTKAGRETRFGNSSRRGSRRWLGREASRAGALVRLLARFSPKNEGFHPKTPNPRISDQNHVYTTLPHI